jgi:hypothetical protein
VDPGWCFKPFHKNDPSCESGANYVANHPGIEQCAVAGGVGAGETFFSGGAGSEIAAAGVASCASTAAGTTNDSIHDAP